MRTLIAALVFTVACGSVEASTATYKFKGGPLVSHSGCITAKDTITITLVYAAPVKEGTCEFSQPLLMKVGDGVHTGTFKPAYFGSAVDIFLCKLNSGNTIDEWGVLAEPESKAGAAEFLVTLSNGGGSVSDAVTDYLCSPAGQGESGAAGHWSGP